MATVREVTFRLERFEWSPDSQLEVAGQWSGLETIQVERPVLTVRARGQLWRFVAEEDATSDPYAEHWQARFDWGGDPVPFEGAQLEIGGDRVVELPPPRARRGGRFGRGREANPSPVALASEETLVPGSPPVPPAPSRKPLFEPQPLDIHAALVAARDAAERAHEEAERFRDDAERARAEIARGHERREAEGARLRADMESLRAMAQDALAREREAFGQLDAQLRQTEDDLADARGEADRIVQERAAILAGRDEERERAQRLASELSALERDSQAALGEARAAVQELQTQLGAARQEIEDAQARSAAGTDQLEAELLSLRQEREALDAAHAAEADALRAHVDSAQRQALEGQEEARRLAEQLSSVRSDHEQATLYATQIEAQLAEAESARAEAVAARTDAVAELESRLAAAQAARAAVDSELSAREAELVSLERDHDDALRARADELERVAAELAAIQQSSAEERSGSLASLQETRHALSEAHADLERSADELAGVIGQRDRAVGEAGVLRAQLAGAEAATVSAREQAAEFERELVETRGRVENIDATRQALQEREQDVAGLRAEVAEAQAQMGAVAVLRRQLADAEERGRGYEAMSAGLEEQQLQLDALRAELAARQSAAQDAEAMRYQLEAAEQRADGSAVRAQELHDALLAHGIDPDAASLDGTPPADGELAAAEDRHNGDPSAPLKTSSSIWRRW